MKISEIKEKLQYLEAHLDTLLGWAEDFGDSPSIGLTLRQIQETRTSIDIYENLLKAVA